MPRLGVPFQLETAVYPNSGLEFWSSCGSITGRCGMYRVKLDIIHDRIHEYRGMSGQIIGKILCVNTRLSPNRRMDDVL